MAKHFESQFGLEYEALKVLGSPMNGFFVEVGAGHPTRLSNTFKLERDFCWNGICIEPSDEFFPLFSQWRDCIAVQAVVLDTEKDVRYNQISFGSWVTDHHKAPGKVGPKPELTRIVRSRTLTSILDEHNAPGVIDFMSVDVEGAEYWVFKGLDFSKYSFRTMLVEKSQGRTHKLLKDNGYRIRQSYKIDTLYVPA